MTAHLEKSGKILTSSSLQSLCEKLQKNRHIRVAEVKPYNETECIRLQYSEMPFVLRHELNNNPSLRLVEQKVVPPRRGLYPVMETTIIWSLATPDVE